MNEPEKFVDLLPREWDSKRENPHEPFLGPGALPMLGQLIIVILAGGLLLGALLLAGVVKDKSLNLLYGESAPKPHLQPGESTTVNGVTIKRLN